MTRKRSVGLFVLGTVVGAVAMLVRIAWSIQRNPESWVKDIVGQSPHLELGMMSDETPDHEPDPNGVSAFQ